MRWKNVAISILGGLAIIGASCLSVQAQSTVKLRNKAAGHTREQAMFEALKDTMFLDGGLTNQRFGTGSVNNSPVGSETASTGRFTTLETTTAGDLKVGTDTVATTSAGGITIGEGTEATAVIDSIFIGAEQTDAVTGTSTISFYLAVGTETSPAPSGTSGTLTTNELDTVFRIRVNGADYRLYLEKI